MCNTVVNNVDLHLSKNISFICDFIAIKPALHYADSLVNLAHLDFLRAQTKRKIAVKVRLISAENCANVNAAFRVS